MKTLADVIAEENELGRRQFVFATRKRGPLTMDEALDLCRRMDGAYLGVPIYEVDKVGED